MLQSFVPNETEILQHINVNAHAAHILDQAELAHIQQSYRARKHHGPATPAEISMVAASGITLILPGFAFGVGISNKLNSNN